MAKKLLTDFERFKRSIDKNDETGCWIWRLSLDKDGYGNFKIGSRKDGTRRTERAHRWSYDYHIGITDKKLTIDHLCRNRACVNPSHLEEVTTQINTKRGIRATATHCKNGHPFSGENLLINLKTNKRRCKKCSIECIKKWNREHPESVLAIQKRYREKRKGEYHRIR